MTVKLSSNGSSDVPVAPRIGEYVHELTGKRSREAFMVIAVARKPAAETATVYAVSATGQIMAGDVILSEQGAWDALRFGTKFFHPGESIEARRFFCERADLGGLH